MGTLSIWHWLLVLLIVILIFGTKKAKTIGQDLGEAIRNFKHALKDDKTTDNEKQSLNDEKTTDNKDSSSKNKSTE